MDFKVKNKAGWFIITVTLSVSRTKSHSLAEYVAFGRILKPISVVYTAP